MSATPTNGLWLHGTSPVDMSRAQQGVEPDMALDERDGQPGDARWIGKRHCARSIADARHIGTHRRQVLLRLCQLEAASEFEPPLLNSLEPR